MKQVSGKEFIRALKKRGWILDRINGSHHIFIHPDRKDILVVPVYGNTPLKTGLLKALMKNAAITESEL